MSYEQEQAEYAKQLEVVTNRIVELESILNIDPSDRYTPISPFTDKEKECLYMLHRQNCDNLYIYDGTLYVVEYKLCKLKIRELEAKLGESKTDRNILKSVRFVGGIIPRHVSGRVYEVKDGDGCAMVCLCFSLFSGLALFIYYLVTEVI